MASAADAIVLAVYMPPHEPPSLRHELRTVSRRIFSASGVEPISRNLPYDWNALTTSSTGWS